MTAFVLALLLIGSILIAADSFVDDYKVRWHLTLHNAYYVLVAAWCLYWSYLLVSGIDYTRESEVARGSEVGLALIVIALASVFILKKTMWKKQITRRQNYALQVVENMGSSDDQESKLRAQMSQLASMLGISVPSTIQQYDGFFEEIAKRWRFASARRTQEEQRKLLEQITATSAAFLNFVRTNAEFSRLPKENALKDLELDAKQEDFLYEIEKKRKAREDLRKPPPEQEQPRGDIEFEVDLTSPDPTRK